MKRNALKQIRDKNIMQVLQSLLNDGTASRKELSERCGISASTVTHSVDFLLETGVVEEYLVGESTGGRKPTYVRVVPDFGCVPVFEVYRDGLVANVFNLDKVLLGTIVLSKKQIYEDSLLQAIVDFVKKIKSNDTDYPCNIIHIGLLCQEDILPNNLTVLFSTDMIPIEKVIELQSGVSVKKGYIERYALDYYVERCETNCSNYAYISFGERITASFVLDKQEVVIQGSSTFDLTPFVAENSSNIFGRPGMHSAVDIASKERYARWMKRVPLAERIAMIIRNASMFFPSDTVFFGGDIDDISDNLPVIREYIGDYPKIKLLDVNRITAIRNFIDRLMLDPSFSLLNGYV